MHKYIKCNKDVQMHRDGFSSILCFYICILRFYLRVSCEYWSITGYIIYELKYFKDNFRHPRSFDLKGNKSWYLNRQCIINW